MIIVSQDKDKIFNFDNVSLIFIQDNNEIWVDTKKTCNLLGKYHTKERTKGVLKMIMQIYQNENSYSGTATYHRQLVYEMPEEEEGEYL